MNEGQREALHDMFVTFGEAPEGEIDEGIKIRLVKLQHHTDDLPYLVRQLEAIGEDAKETSTQQFTLMVINLLVDQLTRYIAKGVK